MAKQYEGSNYGKYNLKYRPKGSSANFRFRKYDNYKNMIRSAKMLREKGNKVVTHIMGNQYYSTFWNLNNKKQRTR